VQLRREGGVVVPGALELRAVTPGATASTVGSARKKGGFRCPGAPWEDGSRGEAVGTSERARVDGGHVVT